MAIHWAQLRSWNGSQKHAFEELCAQLAASNEPTPDSRFFRKGTPDAGVECFWQLPNGDEWAWQAKFFLNSPGPGQWQQITRSVKTALKKHPRLRKYIICLPINLPDGRAEGSESATQKWNALVETWSQLATDKGMTVEFEFWGESEIGGQLSAEKHRGRLWFWFDQESLSAKWFNERVEEALANARDRYSPELNVDLPIQESLDAIGRTPAFYSKLTDLYSAARIAFKNLRFSQNTTIIEQHCENITLAADDLFKAVEPWVVHEKDFAEWSLTRQIPCEEIGEFAARLHNLLRTYVLALTDERDAKKASGTNKEPGSSDSFNYQIHRSRQLQHAVSELADYVTTESFVLANRASLLITGEAGQGKTHLLCNTADNETQRSRPCLILHGEQFSNVEPWQQIIHLLGLNCDRYEFLGALEAAGQALGCRIRIFIDALNEGEGNRLWYNFLPGMLTAVARSPWIGLCVSVRSSYEDLIIPETLHDTQLIRVEHEGFGEQSFKAAEKFFQHYGIEPSTPLLLPEFTNPLILKLYCQSLEKARLKRMPAGLRGLTAFFHFFVEAVDKKLSRHDSLDYDLKDQNVRKVVDELANAMASRKADHLPYDEAKALANSFLPHLRHEKSLFRQLQSENLLTVVPDAWTDNRNWSETVRFTHQRFSDHLIAEQLLDKHFNVNNPDDSFSKDSTLGELLKDERACSRNRGLVEALSIQVPELSKKELPDLVPHLRESHVMRECFVGSIIWRDSGSFGEDAFSYINKVVLAYRGTKESFLESFVALATIPNHPLNADRLHAHLIQMSLAVRDEWWSIFLHHQWGAEGTVDRLVEWAWDENDKSSFDDEVIRLAGITLTWFFTTANRFLRDRATKAMVRLCEKRIDVLRQIMQEFIDVNDLYVSERLYAVASGCAMRTTDNGALSRLAQDVYDWVFATGEPTPHILLRDYARSVIEVAIYRQVPVNVDLRKVRPPYHSDWPAMDIPEKGALAAWKDYSNDKNIPRTHIYESVMGSDDFSRYVIGSLHEWSSQRLGSPDEPTPKEVHERFVNSLTQIQKTAWDTHCSVRRSVSRLLNMDPKQREEHSELGWTDEELEELRRVAEQDFLRTLRKNTPKYAMYLKAIAHEDDPFNSKYTDRLDGQMARRWMMQRIIDMGWTVERFGKFDSTVNRYSTHGREPNKAERIGKKYQWIAYHELLARLSDNFKMYADSWSTESMTFSGIWDCPFRRDIDPSNLLTSTKRDESKEHAKTWWFPTEFNSWTEPAQELRWLKRKDNLPPIERLIEVKYPEDESEWLTLHGYYNWQPATPPGEDRYEVIRGELWYLLHSYLVRREDTEKVFAWAKKQSWYGRWMPESNASYDLQLGEFFWSPAFAAQDTPYHNRQGWTQNGDRGETRIPANVLVTNDEYARENGGFDCSLDGTILIDLPCRFLVEEMNLEWRGLEGQWLDKLGKVAAFDPSVRVQGPRVLLFRRETLESFLETQGLALLWTLLGEKHRIGGLRNHDDYKGRLEINGAYLLNSGPLIGSTNATFVPVSKSI